MNRHDFMESINDRLIIRVTYVTNSKRVLIRKCIPFDIGPSRRFRDKSQRYHFLVLDSPQGRHNLSILPMKIKKIELTEEHFSPSNYIKWKPKWFIKRSWGIYS